MNIVFLTKIAQIVIAVFIVFLTLVQSRGGGLSSTFGGSISMYRSRRGVEKIVFILTIIFGIALVVNSLAIVLLS